ncbi:acyltransferase [Turicibacter sanguinis]|uniref:acyltransferase n=1 Tax=Turicibacter sanguinis TaxID=154288 RepID=UPI0018AAC4A2|nr:acyltransferase [Turicibacter sanguinis]
MLYKILWAIRAFIYNPFFGKIGWASYIGKPIFLRRCKNIFIGSRVRIFPGSRMETYNDGTIDINSNVSIGQNFHVTSAGKLIIKQNTTISGNVFITNIDHEYQHVDCHILEQPMLIKDTIIGENCFIGFGARIQAGTILGKHCVIGTNSVVRGEFPDYCVIVGTPAKIIKTYNHQTKEWERV